MGQRFKKGEPLKLSRENLKKNLFTALGGNVIICESKDHQKHSLQRVEVPSYLFLFFGAY